MLKIGIGMELLVRQSLNRTSAQRQSLLAVAGQTDEDQGRQRAVLLRPSATARRIEDGYQLASYRGRESPADPRSWIGSAITDQHPRRGASVLQRSARSEVSTYF